MDDRKGFGQLLWRTRRMRGLTQAALARQAYCALDTVKKIESGARHPSRQLAAQFADVLVLEGEERAAFLAAAYTTADNGSDSATARRQDVPAHITWTNLPPQVTRFFGREDELALIATRLRDPGCRLLTLIGPGGIGKTRLAVEATARLLADFLDGVCFVALAPVGSPTVLASTIAEALSAPLYGGADPEAHLLTFLAGKRMLLVLDNFEHLLQGTRLLAKILDRVPGLKLLVTSRERLDLLEEWLLPLRGLPFPSDEQPAGEAQTSSALELFAQRAAQVEPGFALTPDIYPAVQRICALVDGMPLGIELAAPWVRLLSCAEIAAEIAKNLDFLATSARNVPDRHRSLRAAFTHSWGLLTNAERAVFQRLSVFRGGFRKEAAQEVAGASLPLLAALVDKSLLRAHLSGRYDLHELLRQYAEEQLQASPGEHALACDCHCRYYALWLQSKEATIAGSDPTADLAEIDVEIENARAAWRWAAAQRRWVELRPLLTGLVYWFDTRNFFQEAVESYAHVAAVAGTAGVGEAGGEREIVYGLALACEGWHTFRLGRVNQARARALAGEAILRAYGASADLALALIFRGVIDAVYEPSLDAKRALQEAYGIVQATRSEHLYLLALAGLGIAAYELHEYVEAERYFKECATLARQRRSLRYSGVCLQYLGDIARSREQHETAQHYYQEGLSDLSRSGDRWPEAVCLIRLGQIAVLRGNYAEAEQAYAQSLAILRAINQVGAIASTLGRMGRVAFARGRYVEARQYHLERLALSREAGNNPAVAVALNDLGRDACALGNDQEAWEHFHDALVAAREAENLSLMLDSLTGLAELLERAGRHEQVVEIAALVLTHLLPDEPHDRAAQRYSDLASRLPAPLVAAARQRANVRSLDQIVAELLRTWE